MSSIILNLINFITAIILVFLLIILPGYSWKKNFYFILLLFFFIADLALIHLQMINLISADAYIPIGLTLIVWYGPSFYFHLKGKDIKQSLHYLFHLMLTATGLWLVFYTCWYIEGAPTWLPTAYFVPTLIFYFAKGILNTNKDQWTLITSWWFAGLMLFFTVESLWGNIDFNSLQLNSRYTVLVFHVLNLGFVMVGLWFIVRNPSFFSDIKIVRKYRYRNDNLSNTELHLIEGFILQEKHYSNAELSRMSVMQATGISIHRISELVNGHFKKNFNEWVNDLRIEEAKKILRSSDLSIKEIYFTVGFSSKSVFNTAFKMRVGSTPSEYRKLPTD